MSTVSGGAPIVPLSQLTGPQVLEQPVTTQEPEAQTVVVPPAFAGEGRGFSALNFGLSPPAGNNVTEATLEAIRDLLERTRGQVDEGRARTQAGERLSVIGLANTQLAALQQNVLRLIRLDTSLIPAQEKAVSEAQARVSSAYAEVTRLGGLAVQAINDRNIHQANADAHAQTEIKWRNAYQEVKDDPNVPQSVKDTYRENFENAEALKNSEQAKADSFDALLRDYVAEFGAAVTEASELKGALSRAQDTLVALVAEANRIASVLLPAIFLFLFFIAASLPDLDEGRIEALIGDLVRAAGEERVRDVVNIILDDVETDMADVSLVLDQLQQGATDLGAIRLAKVGLAFSTLYFTLQEAINALASMVEGAPASPAALSGEGQARMRLAIDGYA